jgi:hypothetical protein
MTLTARCDHKLSEPVDAQDAGQVITDAIDSHFHMRSTRTVYITHQSAPIRAPPYRGKKARFAEYSTTYNPTREAG